MGYYTEFQLKATISKEAPEEVLVILDGIVNNYKDFYETLSGEELRGMKLVADTPELPIDHPFGKTKRWDSLFFCENEGTYFNLEELELYIHSNLKNYGSEIEKFIDWIRPHCTSIEGWYRGEEDEYKTIVNLKSKHYYY